MKSEKCSHCEKEEGIFKYKYVGQLCWGCAEFMTDFYRQASFNAIEKAEEENFRCKVFDSIWLIIAVMIPFIVSKIDPSLIKKSLLISMGMLLFYGYFHNFKWPNYKID